MDYASEPEPTGSRQQHTQASRHQHCRLAVIVALSLVFVAASLGRAANVRAQATNTFPTTTAVPDGGTMKTTVTAPGVTITSSTPVPGCPTTGIGTPSVTYTCAPDSSGIAIGTPIVQTYSGATGPVAETITYNANGPITGFAAVPNFTIDTGNCTAPVGSISTCGLQTSAVTVPTGTFVLAVTAAAGETAQVTSAPVTVGTCPISLALPTALSDLGGFVLVPYTCSSTQSIPSGTNITGVMVATGGAVPPTMTASSNDNAPIAGISNVPAPTIQTLNASATATSEPIAAAGPSVTYQTGWNLVGAPAGTTFSQATNPLYTFPAGATAYVVVPNTQAAVAGQCYWAYFSRPTTVVFAGAGTTSASVTAPAGQYVMLGNPSARQTLTLRGADLVYTFNTVSNSYATSTTLAPGQGAWVLSNAGGTVTIGP